MRSLKSVTASFGRPQVPQTDMPPFRAFRAEPELVYPAMVVSHPCDRKSRMDGARSSEVLQSWNRAWFRTYSLFV
jgi:hypothetical protein